MPASSLPKLSPRELTRYSRHILLEQVGVEGQQRLAASSVLVVGAGGLGSPAALYLAAAGVGKLGIADFDTVEEHNLQRQLLHSSNSVGQAKLASAIARIAEVNPFVTVIPHSEGIKPANAVEIFRNYDVIVDGSDNFSTRYLNNDAAYFAGKPLVYGSIFKFEGQVSVFAPSLGGPCYRCLFPEQPPPDSVPTCGEAGVLGALCGVIGSLQAMEAIKLIVGFGQPLVGRMLTYDALTQSFQTLTLPKDDACPLCGTRPAIKSIIAENYTVSCAAPAAKNPSMNNDVPLEISVVETKALLDQKGSDAVLIDVRETFETEICKIEGAWHIPMRQIPEKLGELPAGKHLLIHCHHGGRSMKVTEYLRSHGLKRVTNVAGGIHVWAETFDPGMKKY